MIQNQITVKNRHDKFIKDVCNSEIIYVLQNEEGFATSSSLNYEDEYGEPIKIICFWSEKARANSCRTEGWEKYNVAELSLTEFIENWCIGMDNDGLLIGTQFDQNMFGFEAEPLELILDLSVELNSIGKGLQFKKFDGIQDLINQVKEVMRNK